MTRTEGEEGTKVAEGMKRCGQCREIRMLREFTVGRNQCKVCRSAYQAAWYIKNRETQDTYRANCVGRILVVQANQRARSRGAPELDVNLHGPLVQAAVDAGFYGVPYDVGGPRSASSPSISRVDHTNPSYVDNYTVEPWALNAFRGSGSPENLVLLVDALEAAHPDGIAGFLKFPYTTRPLK